MLNNDANKDSVSQSNLRRSNGRVLIKSKSLSLVLMSERDRAKVFVC